MGNGGGNIRREECGRKIRSGKGGGKMKRGEGRRRVVENCI